jgi:molecular chaperone DnaK
VLQGEREIAQGNRSLGKFELVGLPLGPRGSAQIEVIFEVDANGILSVSAQDKQSGRQQQMQVTPTSGLSADEIDRLIMEAATAVDTDRRIKETIAMRMKLESLMRNTQRAFKEFSNALTPDEREEGQKALSDGEAAVRSEDPAGINSALQAVERLATLLTMAMMNPASGSATQESQGSNDPNERL